MTSLIATLAPIVRSTAPTLLAIMPRMLIPLVIVVLATLGTAAPIPAMTSMNVQPTTGIAVVVTQWFPPAPIPMVAAPVTVRKVMIPPIAV